MALWLDNREQAVSEQERNDVLAIDALRESAAFELKEKGNAYLKLGKAHYKDALDCYTRAIDQKIESSSDNSVFYANRSQVNLLLGNNRRALNDAENAIRLNPSNLKAYFRGAKAALALGLPDEAANLCTEGLNREPSNFDLKKLKTQVETSVNDLVESKMRMKKTKELVSALEQRQVKLGPHLYKELSGGLKPWLDSSNILHFPVLFLYGEVMSSDIIEDFCEFDKFQLHLQTIYGNNYLPWDEKHEYTRDRIELYYQANAVAPLSKREVPKLISEDFVHEDAENADDEEDQHTIVSGKEAGWVKIDENSTLRDVLAKPDHIVTGIPVFYVVAAGSSFRDLFLSGQWCPP